MASRIVKRRADDPNTDADTPSGKKPRGSEGSATGTRRKTRRSEGCLDPPVFCIDDPTMASQGDTQRSPKPPSADEFKAMLREGLANVAKKEQLDVMMTQVKKNATALVSLEKKVDSANESHERRFEKIEHRLEGGMPNGVSSTPNDSRRVAFEKSRRSIRVWPIAGEDSDSLDATFRDFAVDALLVPDTAVRMAGIMDIIRVRSSPQNSVYLEALVSFRDASERDFYFSKARNLAAYRDDQGNPTAAMRIDIPPFLMSTFRMLNDHGHDIRKAHGTDTRRYIKFDEANLSLYLEIRLPNQVKWTRIKPDQVMSYNEEKDRASYQLIRRGLLRSTPDESSNSNMIPLGQRSQQRPASTSSLPTTQGQEAGVVPTIDGRRPRWIPPGCGGVKPAATNNAI